MYLKPPDRFSFEGTVLSHGWYGLAPFSFDRESGGLSYVFSDGRNKAFEATARKFRSGIRVEGPVLKKEIRAAAKGFERIFSFEHDFSDLYETVSGDARLGWIAEKNAGRMLRSPTVFEDVVKTICTTNCSWALTKAMVTRLATKLGAKARSGKSAFPTPEAMASASSDLYRKVIRAGYRSDYLKEFATSVANGEVEPESWLDPEIPSDELKKQLLSIKGVGDYAAESLLKLLGRFDSLALDSFLRSEFYEKHNAGRKCGDGTIERFYEPFGDQKGIVMWFDICGDWEK
ncbi:MAG: hypothetical protein DWQ47_16630 [Acidobacteria bacterium]|nr:MAG: hypothetical protein DWQ32_04030 [Acidobacteriota bacterium]REK02329.1 MAG: hypothetical protein DWQ38_08120 [Acidobacteriota bacterium]REK13868.1 MAG: hypothetical protein DWQ43_09720 [Acidobacteriota bacterium]REK41863.1 MAG: hypothetical protein DWQ47_16630 [Acidobacteriota bacterium]